jgi:nucleotide-binding universal stress UspA family protein
MKNIKIKTVIIALDYTPAAQKIAEMGYSLAKAMEAKVVLLHILNNQNYYASTMYDPIMGFAGYIDYDAINPNFKDSLTQSSLDFLNKSKEHLSDKTIKVLVKDGDYSEMILQTANEMHADLIVLGTHKQDWFDKILVESTTEAVLANTNIPLFIIPTKSPKF